MLLALPSMLATKGAPAALALSFGELVAAFAVSVAIGLPLGLLIGLSGASRRTLLPIVFLLYAIPQITLLPLIIMLSGIGPAAKIIFGVTHAVFPIIFTLAASVGEVDRTLVKFARITGASSWQVFRYVTFPYAVPSFFNGMRLAMVGAILGVLLAELYGSSAGIGFCTRLFADSFQTKLFAPSVLAAMAVVLNEIMRRAEIRFAAGATADPSMASGQNIMHVAFVGPAFLDGFSCLPCRHWNGPATGQRATPTRRPSPPTPRLWPPSTCWPPCPTSRSAPR